MLCVSYLYKVVSSVCLPGWVMQQPMCEQRPLPSIHCGVQTRCWQTTVKQTRQQPLLDSGQRANGLARKVFSVRSAPMGAYATMDKIRSGVFYAVRAEKLYEGQSLGLMLV
jgi:hypothetical protein